MHACPSIFHILFACNIAWKMDGMNMSWWLVFWPIWASIGLGLVLLSARWVLFVHPGSAQSEKGAREKVQIQINVVYWVVCLFCALLLCYKLAHPNAFPAFV